MKWPGALRQLWAPPRPRTARALRDRGADLAAASSRRSRGRRRTQGSLGPGTRCSPRWQSPI
eukprot:627131-Rhodomonas_salina.4